MPIRALARVAALLVMVATWLAAGPADAKVPDYFAKVERIDIEPYFARMGRVRVFLNIVTLQGQVIGNIQAPDLTVLLDGNRQKQVPGIFPFDSSGESVDLVVVVETGVRYSSALEDLEDPLFQLLNKLPKSYRAAVVAYGGESLHASTLGDPTRAARYWKKVVPEDEPYPPALIDAMKRGVRILKNAPPPASGKVPRRLIFVISDGSNNDEEGPAVRDDFNALIKQALEANITIHGLAFSLNDRRVPYVNLGQMAKKTAGTFRWARGRADFGPMIDGFAAEMRKQMVLTYFFPPDAIAGKKLKIVCKSPNCGTEALESNEKRAPQPMCAGHACELAQACVQDACVNIGNPAGTGGGGLWITAVVVLGLGAGGGVLLLRRRKAQKKEEEEAAAAPPPPVVPQIVVPDFSKIPYLANNPAVLAQMEKLRGMAGVQVGGAAQQPQQPQRPAAPAAMPTTRARLFIANGPRQGQQFPLRHGFTIGRAPGCDVVIEDPWISNHHAQIHLDMGGGCTVVDLGSQTGTFVNGVRTQQQRLTHGMSVRVGQTEIRFLQG